MLFASLTNVWQRLQLGSRRQAEEHVGPHIVRHDQVRIVSLTGAAADHVVVVTALRPPQVGDVGTVVDIADRLGGTGRHYTVACGRPGARPIWLATFAAHELELVAAG